MESTYDDSDKFVTAVHVANSEKALSHWISFPVGVIMHMKVLRFELYDKNKCDALPDEVMLVAIDITQNFIIMNFLTKTLAMLRDLNRLTCLN